ncbi:hypothetical protein TNCT_311011 [Trichonephila clavata]|uniref:Uncharacterized protein n=1 Tax=Trichonephila clavata TaxID=2740835 RepID=A0A8X6H3W7_TRICU|nr:hypothetical protein TNCT_311011 [Trichonephila clavata]
MKSFFDKTYSHTYIGENVTKRISDMGKAKNALRNIVGVVLLKINSKMYHLGTKKGAIKIICAQELDTSKNLSTWMKITEQNLGHSSPKSILYGIKIEVKHMPQLFFPLQGQEKIESESSLRKQTQIAVGLKPDWCTTPCHSSKQYQPHQAKRCVTRLDIYDLTGLVKRTDAN